MASFIHRIAKAKPIHLYYVAANLFGMLVFALSVVGIANQAKMEERDYYDAVDSIQYLTTSIPILLFFALVNFLWVGKALYDLDASNNKTAGILWSVMIGSWIAVYLAMRYYP